jgi:uncharacterized protein
VPSADPNETTEAQTTPPPAAAPSTADPGALGLAGFAMTTFVLSVFNAGLLSESLEPVVLPLALFYGGLGQLLAGMWEFKRGNTFAATAFSSYGAFWLAFAAYVHTIVPTLDKANADSATGLFLLGWTIFTAYMTVASLRTSAAIVAVFVPLTITFLLLAVGALAGSTGLHTVGGWVGLLTALTAWYASFATVTNNTWKREVIPTKPLA